MNLPLSRRRNRPQKIEHLSRCWAFACEFISGRASIQAYVEGERAPEALGASGEETR